jgi:low affinity Fe/Cu permease
MVGLLDRAIAECEVDLSTFAVDKVRKLHECVLKSDEQKRKALGLEQPESPAITALCDLLQGEDDDESVAD